MLDENVNKTMENDIDLENENRYQKLDRANEKYKKFVTINNLEEYELIDKKKLWLPEWNEEHANMLNNNSKKWRNLKHKNFSRGTLVRVNFGVGVGREFGGYHYAITLTKHDNNGRETITVIPLTSLDLDTDNTNKKLQDSKLYAYLEKSIINSINNDLSKKIIPLSNELALLNEFHDKLIEIDNNEKFEQNVKNSIKEKWLIDYKKKLPLLNECSNINSVNGVTRRHISKHKKNILKITNTLKRYEKSDKESVALIANVTTISKLRISNPLNEFDPVGNIQIDKEDIEKIDVSLLRSITNNVVRKRDDEVNENTFVDIDT